MKRTHTSGNKMLKCVAKSVKIMYYNHAYAKKGIYAYF